MSQYLQAVCVVETIDNISSVVCFEDSIDSYEKARRFFISLVSDKCPYGSEDEIDRYAEEGFFISNNENYSVTLTSSEIPDE